MNHSKLYVPDPVFWVNFFKNKSRKSAVSQKGGSNIISSNPPAEEQPMNVELVSPVQAADQRTETTIKRLRKRSRPIQRRRKRINRKKAVSSAKTSKRTYKKGRKFAKQKSKKRKIAKSKRDIFG